MANSQQLGRKMTTISPGASPAEMRPWARDSTRQPYSVKVKRRPQEVSISAVLLPFCRQLWRTTSWTKRPMGSAYSWVRSIGGDCNGRVQKLEVRYTGILFFRGVRWHMGGNYAEVDQRVRILFGWTSSNRSDIDNVDCLPWEERHHARRTCPSHAGAV